MWIQRCKEKSTPLCGQGRERERERERVYKMVLSCWSLNLKCIFNILHLYCLLMVPDFGTYLCVDDFLSLLYAYLDR